MQQLKQPPRNPLFITCTPSHTRSTIPSTLTHNQSHCTLSSTPKHPMHPLKHSSMHLPSIPTNTAKAPPKHRICTSQVSTQARICTRILTKQASTLPSTIKRQFPQNPLQAPPQAASPATSRGVSNMRKYYFQACCTKLQGHADNGKKGFCKAGPANAFTHST